MTARKKKKDTGPKVWPSPSLGMLAMHSVLEDNDIHFDELSKEDQEELLAAAKAVDEEPEE